MMPPVSGPRPSWRRMLAAPFRDRNFRKLVRFLFCWELASSLAFPFFTIYLLRRLDLSLTAVVALNTLALLANVLFLRVWGPFADRFGSKVILSLSASLYLLVLLGWAVTAWWEPYHLAVPLVVVLQSFGGIATAGIILTVGTLGLKLAPKTQSTTYLTAASLAIYLGAGVGPLAGGLLANVFATHQAALNGAWSDLVGRIGFPAAHLSSFHLVFALAFLLGLPTLKLLAAVREEGEASRKLVLEELLAPVHRMTRTARSVPGLRLVGVLACACLRQVPGLDVAWGVTTYQIACSARDAPSALRRGRAVARDLGGWVRSFVPRLGGTSRS